MKRRFIMILMSLIFAFSYIPAHPVFASEASDDSNTDILTGQKFSNWVINDLLTGDTYGIYPISWYNQDMTTPISQAKLWILFAGLRCKMLESGKVTDIPYIIYPTKTKMTVKEVLNCYDILLNNIKFTDDLGILGRSPISDMKLIGVYKGTNGEPELNDICSIEDACVYATRIVTYVYDKLNAGSKGFLWEAKSGGNTVYMLGSIHLASTTIYPFSQKILDAYQKSDALVVEADLFDTQGALSMVQLGMYSDGTTLMDHVSEDLYQKVIETAERYGYSEQVISMFKPWYITSLFSSLSYTSNGDQEDASLASVLGIDMNFLMDAHYFGKPVLEIEGYDYQAKLLNSLSDQLSEYILKATMDSLNDAINNHDNFYSEYLEKALKLWHEGNTEEFRKFITYEDDLAEVTDADTNDQRLNEEYKNILFIQRDREMADYIDSLLTEDGTATYFVVLGSAHYINNYSILELLSSKGYIISPIK